MFCFIKKQRMVSYIFVLILCQPKHLFKPLAPVLWQIIAKYIYSNCLSTEMVYFEITGIEQLILQVFPLINCHVSANKWIYFAKHKDKALSSIGKRHTFYSFLTIEIYNMVWGIISFLGPYIDLIKVERHVINCW